MLFKLKINGNVLDVEAEPQTPLLWVLREDLDLTGTKFGCGISSCGACTVHLKEHQSVPAPFQSKVQSIVKLQPLKEFKVKSPMQSNRLGVRKMSFNADTANQGRSCLRLAC